MGLLKEPFKKAWKFSKSAMHTINGKRTMPKYSQIKRWHTTNDTGEKKLKVISKRRSLG